MTANKAIQSGPISTGSQSHRPIFAVAAVLLAAFLANFDTRLFSVALADIRGGYSLSFDEGAWLSTASSASQIAIAPAVAWMATAFGLRRILGIPSFLYAAISCLVPITHDYTTLLILNTVHGLMLGTFVPAALMIVFRNLPMKWWLFGIAIYSFRVGFSINLGIPLVGVYVSQIGWQWMFWQDALIAPLLGVCVYLGAPHEAINRTLVAEADWGGMLLLGVGTALIYSGLDQGNRLDWFASGLVCSLLVGGLVLTAGFLINEAIVSHPWAKADIILSRNMGVALIIILMYAVTGLSNASLAPNFLIVVGQLKPEQTGWLFLSCAIVPMLVWFPVTMYLVRRYDTRYALIIGFAAFAAAGLMGTKLTHDWSLVDFIPMVLLQSIGQAFSVFPLVVFAVSNLDTSRATAFIAYVQVFRLGGAEIGVSLMTTFLRIREQFQSNILGQHVTAGGTEVSDFLSRWTTFYANRGGGSAPARAVSTLAMQVQREANTLSYIDGFWLTFLFALFALACVAMLTAPPAGPLTPKPR
jgi:MFS transporter, DHA2 family, multidrug resistance protein